MYWAVRSPEEEYRLFSFPLSILVPRVAVHSSISNSDSVLSLIRHRRRSNLESERSKERTMFGRVRAAPTSPDCLDRPPSKMLNHRPLSIYESTLLKLKLGARHDELSSHSGEAMGKERNSDSTCVSEGSRHDDSCSHLEEAVEMEANHAFVDDSKDSSHIRISLHEEAMTIDTDCSSASISTSCSCSQSNDSSKQETKRNVSVLDLFSKYKSLHEAASMSSCNEDMVLEENGYSSTHCLSTSGNCQSFGSIEVKTEEEYISSLPICQI